MENWQKPAGITQLVERTAEKPGAIVTRVRVPGAANNFFPRVNFQCKLSYGVHTAPQVQSHTSTSVRTVKIPNTGSHTIVWTRENTAHTGRNGYKRCSCGCCALPREAESNFLQATKEVLKKKKKLKRLYTHRHGQSDTTHIVQELCESRGGRPGLSVLTSLLVSVDVKLY